MTLARVTQAALRANVIEILRLLWLPMIFVVASTTALHFFLEQTQLSRTEQANAALLASSVAEHLMKDERLQIQSVISELVQTNHLLSVAVYDKQAAPVLGWTYLNQFEATSQLAKGELVKHIQSDLQWAQLNIAAPILYQDTMIGKVQLSISLGRLYMQAALFAGIALLLIGSVTLISAWLLARQRAQQLRPILHLGLIAEQIATLNDYHLRVPTSEAQPLDAPMSTTKTTSTAPFHTLIAHFNDIITRVDSWETDRQAEIRERMEAERRLDILNNHDSLTKLPNRKYFQMLMQDCLDEAVQSQQMAALMFIDLHQFKQVNTLLNYDAGDLILSTISNRIYAVLRNTDTLCRVDGDEFAAILPGIDSQEAALHLAERLLHEINQPMALRGRKIMIAAQIGIACCPLHGAQLRPLLRAADDALKQAKALGPNQIQLAQLHLAQHQL